MALTALQYTPVLPRSDEPPALVEALRRAARPLRLRAGDAADPMERFLERVSARLGARLRFYAPGSRDLSFDEAWLLRLFTTLRTGDAASYRFALQSRLSRERASELHFLACQANQTLDALAA